MLGADEMPDDNTQLAAVEIDFPRLADDSPLQCPRPMTEILEYLAIEVPNGAELTAADLTFVRTAQVESTKYWVWRFREPDGDAAYLTVALSPSGIAALGYDANYYGLTPEQFILGDYHHVF